MKELSSRERKLTLCHYSFVFLQLYHAAHFGTTTEKPLLVPQTTAIQRAVTNLDRIQPYETHKIGVLYVGQGQASNEIEILANQHGSLRYTEFLKRLGTLVRLKDVDENIFLGGLDRNGENGEFTYIWQDDVTQVCKSTHCTNQINLIYSMIFKIIILFENFLGSFPCCNFNAYKSKRSKVHI